MSALHMLRDFILLCLAALLLVILVFIAGLEDVRAATPIRPHYVCPPAGVMRVCVPTTYWQPISRPVIRR